MSDTEKRPPLPEDLKRRIKVEAGHRCAIPTCRHIEIDIHHIVPWAKCKCHTYDNLIALCPNCHRRADRGEIDRKSLVIYKSNLRFIHDKFSQVEVDFLFELANAPPGSRVGWFDFNLIFIKRLFDSGFVSASRGSLRSTANGVSATPIFVSITDSGREYVKSLSLHDIEDDEG